MVEARRRDMVRVLLGSGEILTAIGRRSSIVLKSIVAVTFAAVLETGQYKASSLACTLTQLNGHHVIVAILGAAGN